MNFEANEHILLTVRLQTFDTMNTGTPNGIVYSCLLNTIARSTVGVILVPDERGESRDHVSSDQSGESDIADDNWPTNLKSIVGVVADLRSEEISQLFEDVVIKSLMRAKRVSADNLSR